MQTKNGKVNLGTQAPEEIISPKIISETQTTTTAVESNGLKIHSSSETEIDDDDARKDSSQQTHSYNIHKGISKRAMDISLLTANANQLRLLISYNDRSKTYIACITLVIVSLVLQVLVASGEIIIKSQPKSKRNPSIEQLKIVTAIVGAIITVINILVASLVVVDTPPLPVMAGPR